MKTFSDTSSVSTTPPCCSPNPACLGAQRLESAQTLAVFAIMLASDEDRAFRRGSISNLMDVLGTRPLLFLLSCLFFVLSAELREPR